MVQEETAASYLTENEINEAIRNFSDIVWLRLRKVARYFAQFSPLDEKDLLQEAFARALDGKRHCPRHVDVVKFLVEVMRSIRSDECKSQKRKPEIYLLSDVDDEGEITDSFKDIIAQEEECAQIKSAILALFEEDDIAQMMVEGIMEDIKGEELRSLVNLETTAFASKRKLIRRRIDKAFPKGWNHDREKK